MIDLKIGDKITVLKWIHRRDCSYVGEVLTVKAIQMPLIVVEIRHGFIRRASLDTRECELAHLTPEYVAAMQPDELWPSEIESQEAK